MNPFHSTDLDLHFSKATRASIDAILKPSSAILAEFPALTSTEWNLKPDMDVRIHQDMFGNKMDGGKTDWSGLFEVQVSKKKPVQPEVSDVSKEGGGPIEKKGKKRPRSSPICDVDQYVIPTDLDVLTGRGGFTKKHPGNIDFRKDIEKEKGRYLELGNTRDEKGRLFKTAISEAIVERVKARGGRFLDKVDDDDHDEKNPRWFVMSDEDAREKASQALRTNETPQDRKAKKTKYLLKKKQKQG